jgi:peroxiredoxin
MCHRGTHTVLRTSKNSRESNLEEPNSQPRSLAEAFADVNGQAGPLSSRLAAYRSASSQLRPDIAKAYDQLVERLDVLDRGRVGPQVGEAMSSFSLPDERGRLVLLSKFLESGPVVISINRGHWCPYCKLELRSLAGINADIERLGARVVSIMPDSARFTSDYAAANVLPFPVLSDMDLAYSLSAVLPSRTSRIVSEFGVTAPRWSATAAETRRRQCVKITSAADQSGRARDWPMPMPAAAPSSGWTSC